MTVLEPLSLLAALVADAREQAWMDDALCAQVGTDLFFPTKGEQSADAKRVCTGCPVRSECLEYALADEDLFGVWGGTSQLERRRIRRGPRRPAGAA